MYNSDEARIWHTKSSKLPDEENNFVRFDLSSQMKDLVANYHSTINEPQKTKAVSGVIDRCGTILQSLEGKTIPITTLNVDIVNSTEKVKMLSSEDAGKYYQTFISNTSDLINRYGGYVLKNVGDSVIGFFLCGKFISENHDTAVTCGLSIRDMIIYELNPSYLKERLPSIECRISLDFGEVKVLLIRANGGYSVIDLFGSPLNSISKIIQYAKPNQLVIGDNLFWKFIDIDTFDFKLLNRWDISGKRMYNVYLTEYKRINGGGVS